MRAGKDTSDGVQLNPFSLPVKSYDAEMLSNQSGPWSWSERQDRPSHPAP